LVPFPAYHPNERYAIEHGPCRGLVCHEADVQTLTGRFEKLPFRFRGAIARQYAKQYKKKGRREANFLVVDSLNRLPKTACRLAADDGELRNFAKAKAESVRRAIALSRGHINPIAFIKDIEQRYSIKTPKITLSNDITIEGKIERLKDQHFWRKAIRKSQGRTVEQAARDFDLVHKRAGIYSSDETLHRRKGQKRRNRQMLEEVLAFNDQGDEYTLAELSDLGTSNPEIRRGELMLRIAGFDEVAIQAGHARDFWTLTCPSRFHSHFSKSSERNPKYRGATPRKAQEWLSKVWARVRAKLDRDHELKLYGFRVAEPHHDGCPHWHLLVFLPKEHLHYARGIMAKYALQDSPEEDINCQYRFKAESIHSGKSAAGYLAKYVSKNIAGHAVGQDLLGDDINAGMERVDAWAACWSIRQFQQIGGPPVTVWRELRRMDTEESGILEEARAAADGGKWAAFVKAMGGPVARRDERPLHPAYMQEIKTDTGELPVNKYGELAAGRIVGVRQMLGQVGGLYLNPIYHITRWNNWRFEHAKNGKEAGLFESGSGFDGLGSLGKSPEKSPKTSGIEVQPANRVGAGDIAYKWDKSRVGKYEPPPWGYAGIWYGNSETPGGKDNAASCQFPPPWSSVNNCTGLGDESLMYDSDDIHQYRQLAARPPD